VKFLVKKNKKGDDLGISHQMRRRFMMWELCQEILLEHFARFHLLVSSDIYDKNWIRVNFVAGEKRDKGERES